ncbi:MAG TPA: hypothetical protein VFG95_02420 [Nitrospiria bacterium]|nr:hypothetical protein [Nitrospiria bacterium]
MGDVKRFQTFLNLKNYRAGSILFGTVLIPTLIIGIGLRLLIAPRAGSAWLGVLLTVGGASVLGPVLNRTAPRIVEREWGTTLPQRFIPSLLWRLVLFDLAFWVGNGSFPYARARGDFFIAGLFLINLLLLAHLVPMAHGFALNNLAARPSDPLNAMPFDIALFGVLLIMEGPIDFSMMIRKPEYALPFFGRVLPGEVGTLFTWLWPFIHIVLGYAVLARKRWVFYILLAGGVYGLVSAGFNYYAFGFGIVRTIFVTLIPLLMIYLWWRRRYFLTAPLHGGT